MLTIEDTVGMKCQGAQDNWKWHLTTFHSPLHRGAADDLDVGWHVCEQNIANMGHATQSFYVQKTIFIIRFSESDIIHGNLTYSLEHLTRFIVWTERREYLQYKARKVLPKHSTLTRDNNLDTNDVSEKNVAYILREWRLHVPQKLQLTFNGHTT
jgi:hypothetical protein